jgi:hypothetical protein
LRKNIFRSIIKNLNLALQDENPAFKDNNSKWGCKVYVVLTNSYGREYYQTITILIDSFNAQCNISYMHFFVKLFVFNFMHSWDDGAQYFPIPRVSIYTMPICIHDAHDVSRIMFYNVYIGCYEPRRQFFIYILKYEGNEDLNIILAIE